MNSKVPIILTPQQQEFIRGNLRHIDKDVKPLEGGEHDEIATMVHKATRGIYKLLNDLHSAALGDADE